MGRVIIQYTNNSLESLKCKSKERAKEIVAKRRKVKEWNYYDVNDRIPQPKKKIEKSMPELLEELELMMRTRGLI